MITHADEGPEFEPDDPLAQLLRPTSDHLGPPPGRFETIRRRAARRRLVRTTVGAGLTCAVALLVALPLQNATTTSDRPVSPTVPLAPPPLTGSPTPHPTTGPTVTAEPAEPPVDARPTPAARESTARRSGVAPTPGAEVPERTAGRAAEPTQEYRRR
ncbi:hypothetical protein OOK44_29555 [Streptomyces cellulosae]|uniref:Uncharacterized protein n=1 Tax=Streptomyces thermodiastaticus TaxID=44061 RepID=A0ABU0KEL4_9ACTN|nr:hypothetical protein [Streptomyces cellulosae]MDQ0487836.1 hypothetical protein [Streptomyces thermodiastaticus]MDX3417819.1 hypothetical protein [Streptomyces sp. MD20-1-1]MXQ61099.1 hypothetical protein [Streptomyces sp. XHT-2]MYQ30710.1 hypothetical protein [Streptomyces sp. SID4956]THC58683.1 hypothetical protein E7X38_03015 [Streptomyces sp. Akac8]UVT13434.1 hypothetical protein AY578_31800 [Streptomyces thermocarboxydus]